ncbi:YodC family protein [Enterobacter ludwigii]|uniref:YodC family protein n=1 Tax=Enterobacter ludwigii TaxID=299767 RepID=UPI0039758D85
MPRSTKNNAPSSFTEGDLVVLKSGGPEMTIKAIYSDEIVCQWFAGKKLEQGRFTLESLAFSVPKP